MQTSRFPVAALVAGGVILFAHSARADYPAEVLGDGPAAYWRLGEAQGPDVGDASGNGRGGVAGAGLGFGAESLILPDSDTAAAFSGDGSRIETGGFDKIGDAGFTVEFWVRFDAPPGGFTNLVGDGEAGGDFMLMVYAGPGGFIRAHVNTTNGIRAVDSPGGFADGAVHHVVSTWDAATGDLRLFIDAVLVASDVWGGAPLNVDNPVYLGLDNRGTAPFIGVLDEVALYDHPLDSNRIAAHFDAVEVGEPPVPHPDPGDIAPIPEGLATFIDFDEASGPEAGFTLDFAYDRAGTNDGSFAGAGRTAGIIGEGAASFGNGTGISVNVGSGGYAVSDGISVEALIRSRWTGAPGDYDEIFRKEDGGNRILLSFQNDSFGGGANPPVDPGPVLSFGLNVDGIYGELDMPLDGSNAAGITLAEITDGAVHHVVATYDGASGEKAIWIDGVKAWSVNLGPGGQVASGGGAVATIGNLGPGGGEPFNGDIDEFAFWERALTGPEIVAHFGAVLEGKNYFQGVVGADDYAAEVLADGPVGFWRLGEGAGPVVADASGNSRDGAADAGVGFGRPGLIPPDPDTAIAVSGAPRIVVPGFGKVGAAGFSVEFWALLDAAPSGFANLVGDGESGGDFNLMVYAGPGGIVRAHVRTDSGIGAVDTPAGIADGRFHHVVSTWDAATGELRLHVDAELVGMTTRTGTPQSTDNPLFIGRDGREPGGFSGIIDEVAVYDFPLSPSRILAHFAQVEIPPPPMDEPHPDPGDLAPPVPSLVHFIDFDEADGPEDGFVLNFAYDRAGGADGRFLAGASRTSGLVGLGAAGFDNGPGTGVSLGANGFSVDDGVSVELVFQSTWDGQPFDYDEFFRKEDGDNRILLSFQSDPNNPGANPPVAEGIPVLSFGLNVGGVYGELDVPLDGTNDLGLNLEDLTDGTTHHLAATYDPATGRKAVWIDGAMAWSVELGEGAPLTTGGGTAAVIGNLAGGNEPFTGIIDEFAFWSRALTAAEIAAHHANALAGRSYFASGGLPEFTVSAFSYDPATGLLSMTWNSLPGATYALEMSLDAAQWIEVDDTIPSEGLTTTVEIDVSLFIPPGAASAFFRVRAD